MKHSNVRSHSRSTKGKGNTTVRRHTRKNKKRAGFMGMAHEDEFGNTVNYESKSKYRPKGSKHKRDINDTTFEYRVRSPKNIKARIALKRGLLDGESKEDYTGSTKTKRTISDYRKALKKGVASKALNKKREKDMKEYVKKNAQWI